MDDLRSRAALLRAARAAAGMQQKEAYEVAGIGEGTILDAEAGRRVSEKTWTALAAVYEARGVHIMEGNRVSSVLINLPRAD